MTNVPAKMNIHLRRQNAMHLWEDKTPRQRSPRRQRQSLTDTTSENIKDGKGDNINGDIHILNTVIFTLKGSMEGPV